MVTTVCPNCGGRIGEGDRFCSCCRYQIGTGKPRVTFQEGLKAGLMPAASSVLLTYCAMLLWLLLTQSILARYGLVASESMAKAFLTMAFYIAAMPLFSASMQLVLLGFCANSRAAALLSSAGTTLVMGLIGGFLSIFAVNFARAATASAEYIELMVPCIRGILITVPLVQGAFLLCAVGRRGKQALLRQISAVTGFLLLAVAAELVLIAWLHMLVPGLLVSAAVTAGAIWMLSLISQCFRQAV